MPMNCCHFGKLVSFSNFSFVVNWLSQEANDLECSVFVHPWDMQLDGRMQEFWAPWLVGNLLFFTKDL